jgi:hypothetical protein
MMSVGVAPNDQVEMLFFTVSYEFLQLLGGRFVRADHYQPLLPTLYALNQDRHHVPAGESSNQLVMPPTRMHGLGLSVAPAEYRVYPRTFRPLIQFS